MAEKRTHKEVKTKAAGLKGKTEVPISRGRRLDAGTRSRATEVETSGRADRLTKAASRPRASHKPQRVLVVPQKDMPKARQAMRKVGVRGTVRNVSGTKRSSVKASKSKGGGRTGPSKRS